MKLNNRITLVRPAHSWPSEYKTRLSWSKPARYLNPLIKFLSAASCVLLLIYIAVTVLGFFRLPSAPFNPLTAVAAAVLVIFLCIYGYHSTQFRRWRLAALANRTGSTPIPSKTQAQRTVLDWLIPSRLDFRYDPVVDPQGNLVAVIAKLYLRDTDDQLHSAKPLFEACEILNIRHELDRYILASAQRPLLPRTDELPMMHTVVSLAAASLSEAMINDEIDKNAHHMPYPLAIAAQAKSTTQALCAQALSTVSAPQIYLLSRQQIDILCSKPNSRGKAQLSHQIKKAKQQHLIIAASDIESQHELNQLLVIGIDFLHGPIIAKNLSVEGLLSFSHNKPHNETSTLFRQNANASAQNQIPDRRRSLE